MPKRRKSKKKSKRKSRKNQRKQLHLNKQSRTAARPVRRSPQRKSKQTNYDKCKQDMIRGSMYAFKSGKLKTNTGVIVTSRNQALAISISVASSKCKDKFTGKDYKKGNERMKKKLKKTNYKELITIVEVQRAIMQMKRLKNEKKHTPLRHLQRDTMARILMAFPPNETNKPIPQIILRDIQKYIINDM